MSRAEALRWSAYARELIASGLIVVRKIAMGVTGLPRRGVPKWFVLA